MILLASAKTMKQSDITNATVPAFKSKSQVIRDKIRNMEVADLAKYFKIKGKTLENTHKYYSKPVLGKVITSLDGAVFKQIRAINEQYVANNVYVIDAMYGILNGNDQIELFRLDFNLKSVLDCSYYSYWQEDVNAFINEVDLKQLLVLTSDEYTKVLDQNNLDKQIFEIEFDKEIKSSVHKKQCRGKIANYCIEHQITDYYKLDNIIIDEYNLKITSKSESSVIITVTRV